MGTVTKWRQTEEAAAKLELLLRQIEHCFCDKVSWWQLSKKEEMATNVTSPFSPTASDKVDTSSYSTASQKKIDTSLSKMERRISGSQLLSPTATTEQVYQHLGLAWPPIRKLRLSEGSALAKARLTGVDFEVSPSQPVTPGQGNSCMFHALLDQLRFQQASLSSIAVSHSQLRGKLVQAAYNSIKAGKLTWPEGESLEEWRSGMAQEGTMGDQVILQAAANLFQRQIVILPVFWSAAHLPSLGITLISPSSKTSKSPTKTSTSSSDALFVQYYSESRFLTPHYQSVRPKKGQNHLVNTLRQWLIDEGVEKNPKKEEEEDDFIKQLNELPDPPCTPVRNLRPSFFTPSPYNSFILPSSSPPPSSVSPSPSSSFSMSSASSSSPPSSPSMSNGSTSSEFMHLLEREVRGLGRQTRI